VRVVDVEAVVGTPGKVFEEGKGAAEPARSAVPPVAERLRLAGPVRVMGIEAVAFLKLWGDLVKLYTSTLATMFEETSISTLVRVPSDGLN